MLRLQAANLFIRGSPRLGGHCFNCARAGTFVQASETTPCQIKLAKAIKVLDRRYVADRCCGVPVAAGPLALQARPILIRAQATLISLPSTCHSNHTEERIIRKQEGTMPISHRSPLADSRTRMPYTMPSEIAWYAATSYFSRASFLRTASTSARESRIYIDCRIRVVR